MNEVILEKKFELSELLDLRVLGEVLRTLADLFNSQLRIFETNGKELFDTGGESHFCGLLQEANLSEQICRAVKEKLLTQPITGSSAVQVLASCGAKYTVVPISYQFEPLGRVVLGPYQDQGMSESRLLSISAQYHIDSSKFISAYKKLPNPSPEQIKKMARFTSKFLDAFVFINTKRLLTSLMHLELMMQAKDRIFKDFEKEIQRSAEDQREIDKYKKMF